jgi:hypothetical protein
MFNWCKLIVHKWEWLELLKQLFDFLFLYFLYFIWFPCVIFLLTLKNVHFVKLSKYEMDFIIASLSLRWSKNMYEASNSESRWRSHALEKMLRCQDFRWSTQVGNSDCRDFQPKSGFSTIETSEPSRDFWPMLGLSTQVETSSRPNKKACSDLAFWILIRIIPNLWET